MMDWTPIWHQAAAPTAARATVPLGPGSVGREVLIAFPEPDHADGTIDDRDRIHYLRGHIEAVAEAIAAGVVSALH